MGWLTPLFKRSADAPAPIPAPPPAPDAETVRRRHYTRNAVRSLLQAAQSTRTEASWDKYPTSIDTIIVQNWTTMVARARHGVLENDYAKKYASMVKGNLIGADGIRLLPQIQDPNGKPDQMAGDAIAESWKEFSERGYFDVTGTMSRVEFEQALAGSCVMHGEYLVEIRYGPQYPHGVAFKMLDPMQLEVTHNEVLGNGNVIRHGIEFNSDWKPVRYWLREYQGDMIDYALAMGQKYRVVEASNIIHDFVKEGFPGQKRGLPWLRTAMWRLRMLKGFEDAALVNARVGAAKMGLFRSTSDGAGDDVETEELPMDCEPGTFENIGEREFVAWTPQFPEQSTESFSREMKRGAASGLDVSYNNLASDLTSVNFSSIRQGALDEREAWKNGQGWFIGGFERRAFNVWLEVGLLAGRITVNGKPLKPERLSKYKRVAFQGRRWAWIDPQAEVAAYEKAIALRITSRSQIIRDMGGEPWELWKEISTEEKDMKSVDLDPNAHAQSNTAAGAAAVAKVQQSQPSTSTIDKK